MKHLIAKKGVQPLVLFGIRGSSLVCKFLLTLFIAHFLGFEVLGFYGLVTAATIVIPGFLGLSLMYTISRRAVTETPEQITKTLMFYAQFLLLLYAVLTSITIAYGVYSDKLLLSALVMLAVFLEHINNDLYTLLLNRSKPLTANFLHFIRSAVWIVIYMGLAFVFPELQTVEALIGGWICGGIISFAGFVYLMRHWPWVFQWQWMPFLTWLKTEFLENKNNYFNNAVRTGNQYLNHFLITVFLGMDLTGVYVYFMQVFSAMSNLLQTGVIQIARPKLVRAFKEKDAAYGGIYKKCLLHTMIIASVMACGAWPAMYILTFYVVDKPLAIEWFPVFLPTLVLFVLAMIGQVMALVFYSQHRDDIILKVSIVFTPLGVISNVVMIYYMGLWGAVFAPILVVLLSLAYQQKFVKKLV